jgi:CheY-like chemotaxis protein
MKGRRILVVDDSAADRAALRIAFGRAGPEVALAFAESAREALALLRAPNALRPQMMLVDVHMPGGSGLELLGDLKRDERLRGIPVFMLSGSQDPRDVAAAYRGQACGFVAKPGDFESLRRFAELMARLCTEALDFPDGEA